ncbi:hypothetical protein HCH_05298 [Hahella chejuensis KCTC 2396]|uniref:Uncharacterized protein n=1 Tax=Hahella chejuensis (strain KCTC 2396) TaxID=349521 RepID=Q2SBK3_HAHCH|nr:hypothetical protein HCH_05298 [Hahella chejuensis KCTC 2396]
MAFIQDFQDVNSYQIRPGFTWVFFTVFTLYKNC